MKTTTEKPNFLKRYSNLMQKTFTGEFLTDNEYSFLSRAERYFKSLEV